LKKRIGGTIDLVKLSRNYDLVLADSIIYKRLSNLLGTHFFKTKKFPMRIYLDPSSPTQLSKEIERCVSSSSVMFSNGSLVSIRVGRKSMDPTQIGENVQQVLAELNAVLDGKLTCMKIGIEFERNEKGTGVKGNEWPNMPI